MRIILSFSMLALCVALGVGVYNWFGSSPEPPPAIDPKDVDPVIVEVIEAARAQVLKSPRGAETWGKLGMTFQAHEYLTEADLCFQKAETLDPKEPRWPYYRADALVRGNPAAALEKFRQAAELVKDRIDTPRLRLAELLLTRGQFDEAENEFHKLLAGPTTHGRAYLGLARIALQRGDAQVALKLATSAERDDRVRRSTLEQLAEIHERLGNHGLAEAAGRRAAVLPRDPDWPDPYGAERTRLRAGRQAALERAAQLIARERTLEALELLRSLVRTYPESDWGWYLLGKAAIFQGNRDLAETALVRAVSLNPKAAEAHFFLGLSLFQRRAYAEAAASYRKAIELKSDYALAHLRLGLCLRHGQNDRAGATAAFETALRCQPTLIEARLELADLKLAERAWKEAAAHLKEVLAQSPGNVRAKSLLARLWFQAVTGGMPRSRQSL